MANFKDVEFFPFLQEHLLGHANKRYFQRLIKLTQRKIYVHKVHDFGFEINSIVFKISVVNQFLTSYNCPEVGLLCHFKIKGSEFNKTFPCIVQKLYLVRKNIKANLQNSN